VSYLPAQHYCYYHHVQLHYYSAVAVAVAVVSIYSRQDIYSHQQQTYPIARDCPVKKRVTTKNTIKLINIKVTQCGVQLIGDHHTIGNIIK